MGEPITYATAGVDVEAGDRAVELMKAAVAGNHASAHAASGVSVLGGVGGFAGLVDAKVLTGYRHPILATSTDGVGTKIAVARALDKHDTIGADLVAMVVDDLVVCGARPLFMTDYIACGRVVPERIAAIVGGVAAAAAVAGCALVGGETAEHPGLMAAEEYDIAGAATGVVEADALLGPDRVRAGDLVLALGSSGLHSNGYSLIRRVLAEAGWQYDRQVPELGRSLGEELLEPTRIYAADLLALIDSAPDGVRSIAHVTGGGLAANLARVLPRGLHARLDRATWTPAPVFTLIAQLGRVPREDAERTLNQGIGMAVVIAPDAADAAIARLAGRGVPAWVAGDVSTDSGQHSAPGVVRGTKGTDGGSVALVGEHPR